MNVQTPAIELSRFEFGANWRRFLELVDDHRIREAESSLRQLLGVKALHGKSFLDIGSGSGLFSLAARRLGGRVHSFDYDLESVACTAELRRRYFPDDPHWTIEQGSALDSEYLSSLGTFDVIYSWGVLHHTGQMWQALETVHRLVAPGGQLAIAIYNDAGGRSARWKWIKRNYNRLPRFLRPVCAAIAVLPAEARAAAGALIRLRPQEYLHTWTRYSVGKRGMSRWRDIVDWVGGYPYETARPDAIFNFYRARGFVLARLKCSQGQLGCNEFVFVRGQGVEEVRARPVERG